MVSEGNVASKLITEKEPEAEREGEPVNIHELNSQGDEIPGGDTEISVGENVVQDTEDGLLVN